MLHMHSVSFGVMWLIESFSRRCAQQDCLADTVGPFPPRGFQLLAQSWRELEVFGQQPLETLCFFHQNKGKPPFTRQCSGVCKDSCWSTLLSGRAFHALVEDPRHQLAGEQVQEERDQRRRGSNPRGLRRRPPGGHCRVGLEECKSTLKEGT